MGLDKANYSWMDGMRRYTSRIDTRTPEEKLREVLFDKNSSLSPKIRKHLLIKYLSLCKINRIRVNSQWCVNLNKDKDVQQLILSKKLRRVREQKSRRTSHTYVELT